ncbi:MAG: DUF3368 domain-containing protein [Chloroflexota bacterium]|nr:DUF3368 domain-containing protein [Chloroflexota bacterium]
MTAVADAGPLIALARAGVFDLLREVWQELVIPEAVHEEVVREGADRPGVREVVRSGWIRVSAVADRTQLVRLPTSLHSGEREAIVLSRELELLLLVDDSAARAEARRREIPTSGSLGTLVAAKGIGVIGSVRPVLDRLIAAGFRAHPRLYEQVLRRAGEWP